MTALTPSAQGGIVHQEMTFGHAIDLYIADMRAEGRITSAASERSYRATLNLHADDVRDGDFIRRLLPGIDVVFNLAASISVPYSFIAPREVVTTNVEAECEIAGKTFKSRLIIGTGKYKNYEDNARALEASGAEIVTVAVRRVNLTDPSQPKLVDFIDPKKVQYLPNTAGCFTGEDAVRTLRLAREAGKYKIGYHTDMKRMAYVLRPGETANVTRRTGGPNCAIALATVPKFGLCRSMTMNRASWRPASRDDQADS